MKCVVAAAFVALVLVACGAQVWSFDPVAQHADASANLCSSDADCAQGTHCDPLSGQCVACVSNDECMRQGLRYCNPGAHTCVECNVDADCEQGLACSDHQCVPSCGEGGCGSASVKPCTDDADCVLPSLHCDPVTSQCVACVSDGQCQSSMSSRNRCNFSLYSCVQCATAGDCASDQQCDRNGQCVPSCASGQACPSSAPYCTAGGVCAACRKDTDCSDAGGDRFCDPVNGQCGECTSDGNCPKQYHPRCDPTTDECVQCLRQIDCGVDGLCNPETHACVYPNSR